MTTPDGKDAVTVSPEERRSRALRYLNQATQLAGQLQATRPPQVNARLVAGANASALLAIAEATLAAATDLAAVRSRMGEDITVLYRLIERELTAIHKLLEAQK